MRIACLALLAALAAPRPAPAADLPPAPPAGAPVEYRLYIASDSLDALDLLLARVACVAVQRAAIAARLEAGLLARGWSGEAGRLWRLYQALEAFEAAHIRPLIDADTQDALLDAYFPSAVGGAEGGETRARRCLAFADAWALRRVAG